MEEENKLKPVVKRWIAYVCPECHMIFRMEAGNGGRRAQCPGCRALMILGGKMPEKRGPAGSGEGESPGNREAGDAGMEKEEPGDATDEHQEPDDDGADEPEDDDGAEEPEEDDGESGPMAKLAPRMRIKKRKGVRKVPAWEKRTWRKKRRRIGWLRPVVSVLCLMGVGAGVAYWAHSTAERRTAAGGTIRGGVADELDVPPEPGTDTDVAIDELAAAVRRFLEAEGIDDLLETVRFRQRLEPIIRRHYREGFTPVVVREIAPDGSARAVEGLFSVLVEMEDFKRRPIALEKVDGGFLVDWESWVGYSELPWDEFMCRRPTESAVFRVKTRVEHYYNYEFSDEDAWRSFQLQSPDGERTLYGYVPRHSAMERELMPLDPGMEVSAHTLALRYPEGASRGNQVLVERVLASGWVLKN